MQVIETKIQELGLNIPPAPQPVGNYKAYTVTGKLLYISGQMPIENGDMKYKGQLGNDLSVEEGQQAAKLAALNILSQINLCTQQTGFKFAELIKLEGYINASEDFEEHASVLNGASDLMSFVLNERAGHIRTVVGCTSLPGNAAVEISAIVALA
ncbi:MAG: RidA family protein [Colwellia sp.]